MPPFLSIIIILMKFWLLFLMPTLSIMPASSALSGSFMIAVRCIPWRTGSSLPSAESHCGIQPTLIWLQLALPLTRWAQSAGPPASPADQWQSTSARRSASTRLEAGPARPSTSTLSSRGAKIFAICASLSSHQSRFVNRRPRKFNKNIMISLTRGTISNCHCDGGHLPESTSKPDRHGANCRLLLTRLQMH